MKIIHTADWHLREAHLSMTERGEDFFKAAAATVDIAKQCQAECMVAVGDLLNEGRPSSLVISQLRQIHQRAVDAQLRVFCVLGNHDAASPSWYSQVTDGAKSDKEHTYGLNDITNTWISFRGTAFVGLPAIEGHELLPIMHELTKSIPDKTEVVWLWHGAVREFVSYPSEKYIDLPTLTQYLNEFSRFDNRAFLLGDIHETNYSVMHPTSGPCTIGYPGATELVKRNDQLQHTCTLIDLDKKDPTTGVLAMELYPVPSRPAIAFRLYTADQVLALKEMVKPVWDQKPIVLINYSTTLPNAVELVQAHLDPSKCFLRMAALPDVPGVKDGWYMFEDAAGKLRAEGRPVASEVMAEFVPPIHPAYQLGQDLLKLTSDRTATELVDFYVRERLDKLSC